MSGLLRNLIAFFLGLCGYASRAATDTVETRFWVTPFDSGIRVLKSDKYLQYAETAQLDYLLKVGRFFAVLRGGAGFVNLAQQVRFLRPIGLFSRVRVETRLLYADEKCAYFQHALHVRDNLAAEVLVKMKFKKAGRTLAPATFLAFSFDAMPDAVRHWEAALQG
ncbi:MULTISPECIES: thioesterase family protein [unclassified Pseudomonas]|uniref:thioesterase family protein n=1 Tax=unclassified Pseudomonas TaxID=196821 RepID=UPI00244B70FD|nr:MULTISPECIES: thioesterase family protein [unclassified Pseudomonas]MDG9922814.1 thioesterase family protein [Pseudomonas sp. GD04045]MDH0036905.1 thioesterase family protein [Pseudomonas sp. GD04019]